MGILKIVNDSIDPKKPTFELIGDPNDTIMKSHWFKAKCLICPREILQLCPPKQNLEANLMNHVHGIVHNKALEDLQQGKDGAAISTGKRGRPSRTSTSSSQFGQTDLHTFFKHTEGEILTYDRMSICAQTCSGLRGPHCIYGGKSYGLHSLLFDPHPGKLWYPEPHFEACFSVEGDVTIVKGAFRHRSYRRVSEFAKPFPNFTCDTCQTIVSECDFRSGVIREERAVEKRGCRGTALDRRVGYLSVFELSVHSRLLTKKLKTEQMQHWSAKARIAQLKVSRPTLRKSAKRATAEHNVYKFCTDILLAHRTGAMGGKPALWDFLKNVANNLNHKKQGARWSRNSLAFSQAMKMYGGRRMCDLFSLNFASPNYSSTKRVNQKGDQFVPGEHIDIFWSVAQIYKEAKEAHGIQGLVHVILPEDETKVKGRVS